MSDAAQLKRFTVAQLKARCQELGLQGISKLNKAQLAQRILNATTAARSLNVQALASSTPPDPTPTPTKDDDGDGKGKASSQPAAPTNDGTSTADDAATAADQSRLPPHVDEELTRKTKKPKKGTAKAPGGGETERANSQTPSPATKKRPRESSKKSATTKTASVGGNKRSKKSAAEDSSAAAINSNVSSLHPPFPALSPSDATSPSATPSRPTPDVSLTNVTPLLRVPTTKGSDGAPNPTVTTATTSPRVPTKTTRTPAKRSATIVPSKTGFPAGSKPQTVPRTRLLATPGDKKSKRSSNSKSTQPAAISAPKFTPLARVKPLFQKNAVPQPPAARTFPLVPLTSTEEHQHGTAENRVAHIKSHFLNRLFVRLNGTRNPPILGAPFPAPYEYPVHWNAGLAFPGIHPNVFGSSNDAFEVAKRFWIARAHTMFQLGCAEGWSVQASGKGLLGPDLSLWPPVMSCEKVVDEIYLVKTQERVEPPTGDSIAVQEVRYLVLAQTGDVVATSRVPSEQSPPNEESFLIHGCRVRPDWHTFISSRFSRPSEGTAPRNGPISIMAAVKTKDQADFPLGINKSWAVAVGDKHLLQVAERFVLTSCMLNSFAGAQLSAMEMEASWLNQSTLARPARNSRVKTSIELYLPESYQVLSVHLPPPPFHPALAIVHRHSGQSEYMLRETGHVVGDEDGVVELWQGLLGCDYRGHEKDSLDFWKGWEKRLKELE